eukprot:SAG11_NODE_2079_length_3855_cov_1.533280_4_plen_251_part_00
MRTRATVPPSRLPVAVASVLDIYTRTAGLLSLLNVSIITQMALVRAAKIVGAINGAGLAISLGTGSHLHLDLLGTGAFAVAAIATRGTTLRTQVSAAAIGIWGTRLAGFLFYRALQVSSMLHHQKLSAYVSTSIAKDGSAPIFRLLQLGHDARLDETLASTAGSCVFWGVSFVWGFVVLLPHTIAQHVTAALAKAPRTSLGLSGAVGISLAMVGFAVEALADQQKWSFKQDSSNAGKFCNTGLWASSQHP